MKRIFVGTCVLAACAFAVAAGTTQSTSAATDSQAVLQEPTEPPQQPEPAPEPTPQEPPPTEPPPTEPPPTEPPPTEPAPTEPAPQEPTEPGAPPADMGDVTLKGCLQAGDEEGTFKLTNIEAPEGGEAGDAPEEVTLKAPEGVDITPLTEQVGTTVELSGSWAELSEDETGVAEAGAVGGGKVFEPRSVQPVSASCEGI
ncbi:MAG: hypothetical protein GEU99_06070 [Luteitalea sp.]|nr:hypothetical protein [Luteitalea sp.]